LSAPARGPCGAGASRGELGEIVEAEVLDHVPDDAGAARECVERDFAIALEPLGRFVVQASPAAAPHARASGLRPA
jgi:hypothetical protein